MRNFYNSRKKELQISRTVVILTHKRNTNDFTAMNTSSTETNNSLEGLTLIAIVSCVLSAGYYFLTNLLA